MRDVAIDSFDFTPDEVRSRLDALFEAAKARDEFEFGCTLLRVRGMESAGWGPFVETSRLVDDLLTLSGAPLVGHTKVRLGLLFYSHLTEVSAIYDMLANLTLVIAGERYTMYPFLDLARHLARRLTGKQLERAQLQDVAYLLVRAGPVSVAVEDDALGADADVDEVRVVATDRAFRVEVALADTLDPAPVMLVLGADASERFLRREVVLRHSWISKLR